MRAQDWSRFLPESSLSFSISIFLFLWFLVFSCYASAILLVRVHAQWRRRSGKILEPQNEILRDLDTPRCSVVGAVRAGVQWFRELLQQPAWPAAREVRSVLNCQTSLTFVHSYIEFSLTFFTVLILSFCHLPFVFSKSVQIQLMTRNIQNWSEFRVFDSI